MTGTELSFHRIAGPVIRAFRPYDLKTSLKRGDVQNESTLVAESSV